MAAVFMHPSQVSLHIELQSNYVKHILQVLQYSCNLLFNVCKGNEYNSNLRTSKVLYQNHLLQLPEGYLYLKKSKGVPEHAL